MRPNYFKYIDSRLEHLCATSYHGGMAVGTITGFISSCATMVHSVAEYNPVELMLSFGAFALTSTIYLYQKEKSNKHNDKFLESWRNREENRKRYPEKFTEPYDGLEDALDGRR